MRSGSLSWSRQTPSFQQVLLVGSGGPDSGRGPVRNPDFAPAPSPESRTAPTRSCWTSASRSPAGAHRAGSAPRPRGHAARRTPPSVQRSNAQRSVRSRTSSGAHCRPNRPGTAAPASSCRGRPEPTPTSLPPRSQQHPLRHPGSKHGRLSVEALYTRCDELWRDAGLTPLRLHVARHTCASYLRAAEVDLKVRSAILGHASTSSLSMTEDRCTHLMPDDVEKAKQALADYLATGTEGRDSAVRFTPRITPGPQCPMESRVGPRKRRSPKPQRQVRFLGPPLPLESGIPDRREV
jgi:hypothetical protein